MSCEGCPIVDKCSQQLVDKINAIDPDNDENLVKELISYGQLEHEVQELLRAEIADEQDAKKRSQLQSELAQLGQAATDHKINSRLEYFKTQNVAVTNEHMRVKASEEQQCPGPIESKKYGWFGKLVTRQCGSEARKERLRDYL